MHRWSWLIQSTAALVWVWPCLCLGLCPASCRHNFSDGYAACAPMQMPAAGTGRGATGLTVLMFCYGQKGTALPCSVQKLFQRNFSVAVINHVEPTARVSGHGPPYKSTAVFGLCKGLEKPYQSKFGSENSTWEACVPSAHFYSKISLLRPRFDHLLYEVFSRYVLKQPLEKLNLWKHIIQFTLTTPETNKASLAHR